MTAHPAEPSEGNNMPSTSPTVAGWELGFRLWQARERVGMTGTAAARAIGISQNHISNLEHGRRKITTDGLHHMAEVYEFDKTELENLLALRETANSSGWWSRYSGHFRAELLRLFGYEDGAAEIKICETSLVCGLLQTEAYARAIHKGDGVNLRRLDIERRVEVRMRRQQRLFDSEPLRAVVVLGEGALRTEVGGPEVLAEQLRYLLDAIDEYAETLEVRVLPFAAGSCTALGSTTFHVLTFPDPAVPPVAWHETAISLELLDERTRVQQYELIFDEALSKVADREASQDLVRARLRELT